MKELSQKVTSLKTYTEKLWLNVLEANELMDVHFFQQDNALNIQVNENIKKLIIENENNNT